VRCGRCHHENPEGARFCGVCGEPLAEESPCLRCGATNPASNRFCHQCGSLLGAIPEPGAAAAGRAPRDYTPRHLAERILQDRSALEGERKQLTVLFADVKGSMELAERIDPEEWHAILDRFFQILSDGVHRFEGTINQYTGDGVMALFGAPIAHEDHAQRACYAALHLRDGLKRYADQLRVSKGLNFSVRMGLNSGEVIVGKIGDDLRMDYTAQGHTVGLAQRMEQLAETGKALLTEHTAKRVEGYFRLRDLGASKIRGVEQPVGILELEGVGALRTRLDRSRARGFSKFVGRGDDVATLEAALEHAIEGKGRVVGIVAEAGLGKSRLCFEIGERCRANGILVREARGIPHGRAVPLLPVLEFYREAFGIEPSDSDTQARQKIAGAVAQADRELLDALPLLFEFMAVPDPERPAPELAPDARERRLLSLLRRLTAARSQREPAVIVFEDLHWIDPATESFVEMLADVAEETRTLLLVNFRPEYHSHWMHRSYYQQLALLPLESGAIAELLGHWIGGDPSLVGLPEQLCDRTGGNPFFIEEVVQEMIESGALTGARGSYRLERSLGDVAIPDTVQALLAARIDRLAEREKQLLQTAAVIGREFPEPLLAAVAKMGTDDLRDVLRRLVQAEFLYEQAVYPEVEFAFKHPLTQEVAYTSQLRERRAETHAAVAKAIEDQAGDKAAEHAALLAHHWELAGDALQAARWHCRAADAAGLFRAEDALLHWRKARALAASAPESTETRELANTSRAMLLYFGARTGMPNEEIRILFDEASRTAGDETDFRARALLFANYGAIRTGAGDMQAGARYSAEGVEAADRTQDRGLQVMARYCVEMATLALGHYEDVCRLHEECEAICGSDDAGGELEMVGYHPYLGSLILYGFALENLGRGEESDLVLHRLEALQEQTKDVLGRSFIHAFASERFGQRGDGARALAEGRLAFEGTVESSNPVIVSLGRRSLAQGLRFAGRWEEAIEAFRELRAYCHDHRVNLQLEPDHLTQMAEAQLGSGDWHGALELADEALAIAKEREAPGPVAPSEIVRARAWLASRDSDAAASAEGALARAEACALELKARSYLPQIHELRAEVTARRGDAAARAHELHEAERLFREIGWPQRADRVARALES
jgi:class 3 adenylate cyclase/tetratricopeptide (TPR) repeat protein